MTSTKKNTKCVVFFTTFSNKTEAHKFANFVTSSKLVSCVNLIDGISSHYIWKGKLHVDTEILAIGKTTTTGFQTLKKKLTEIHSYELPELIAIPIVDGHPPYLKWLTSK